MSQIEKKLNSAIYTINTLSEILYLSFQTQVVKIIDSKINANNSQLEARLNKIEKTNIIN